MTITHILGIDPGLSGAIALLTRDGELFDVADMPTIAATNAKGKATKIIDHDALIAIINDYADHANYSDDVQIIVEQQSTRPGLAAGAVFKTGYGYGLIIGISATTGCNLGLVLPQDWKQWHGLIGAGSHLPAGSKRTRAIKLASREAAMLRFPHHADMFRRVKDDGRAEAALIGDAYLRSLVARPVAA
jgi:crossover junction endodeoxyribonuclease RuvC